MNSFILITGIIIILLLLFIKNSYYLGFEKSIKNLLSLLVPIILSGTAIRIGRILLPDSINISYYITGIGMILFYLVLAPIITKVTSDRYRKVSKKSRIYGACVGILQCWLFISFILFFINLIFYKNIPVLQKYDHIISILTLPIQFFWNFPNM
ncbi:MAG: hypothetical protein KFW21_03350 [Spirochaetota bacterium]|nr:hypothetical protein [Spirochaetota bacterium]